ncbi:MAG: hypothetical protein H7833_09890 [Magnetococcus sp. DMHC-1]
MEQCPKPLERGAFHNNRRKQIRRRNVSPVWVARAGDAFLHRKRSPLPDLPSRLNTSRNVPNTVKQNCAGEDSDSIQNGDEKVVTPPMEPAQSGTGSMKEELLQFELPPIQTRLDMEIGLGRILDAVERQQISREEGRRLYGLIGSFHKRQLLT